MRAATTKKVRIPQRVAITALLMGAMLPEPGAAQDSRERLLVSAEWLVAHIDDPGVVVIQPQSRGYAQGHIPGARQVPSRAVTYNEGDEASPDHKMLELPPDLEQVRGALEQAGVSDGSHVVITFEGRGMAWATRLLWTSQVLGLTHVSLLDGGNAAWEEAGGVLVTEVPPSGRGSVTSPPDLSRRVDKGLVRRVSEGAAAGYALLDARAPASYDGVEEERPGRAGHIPGAENVPMTRIFDERGRLRSPRELKALFDGAGVASGDQIVAYCHIGLWATTLVFAARTLGYEAVLYDGSMSEWARDSSLPLVRR